MSDYEIAKLGEEIVNLIKILIGVQALIFFAWLAQLIANLTIIIQLPKIKKYQKRIFQKLYNFENEKIIDYKIEEMEDEEEQERKNRRIETFKKLYTTKNKKNEKILDSLEDYKKSDMKLDKEVIEYAILGILIGIIIILIISILNK